MIFCLVHGSTQNAAGWSLLGPELAHCGHRSICVPLPNEPDASATRYAEVIAEALPDAADDSIVSDMKPPFRSKQEVIINAPLETVWAFNMDITKIPTFHPRVVKVELLSGKTHREPGVSYKCHLAGGKHMCVEKDIEIVPMQKLVTVLPEDTFGICKILPDYVVETTVHRVGHSSTKIEISHYYSTPTLKAQLLNLIARRKIARDTQDMLTGMKAAIEKVEHKGESER